MAATTDIRLDRVKHEYQGVSKTQDALMDRIDTYEAALTGLTASVAANREDIQENSRKLDAIMEHLQVPYEKPPMGFKTE